MKGLKLGAIASVCLAVCASLAAAGSLSIDKAAWKDGRLEVGGHGATSRTVRILDGVTNNLIGNTAVSKGEFRLRTKVAKVPCLVKVESGSAYVTSTVSGTSGTCGSTSLSTARLSTLKITGPAQVAENSSAQYTALAVYSDGSEKDVTGTARWSENSTFGSVKAGLLTTSEVTGNQTMSLRASYTESRTSRSASLTVEILDSAGGASGSHANRFSSYQGTATCLTCHRDEALEIHASAHYQWKGDSSAVIGSNGELMGKLGGINDFCIYPDINWIGKLTNVRGEQVDGGCARCHTGLGLKPTADSTEEQLLNIDCLICHSSDYRRTVGLVNGQFRFVPDTAAMQVSLLEAAQNITLPSSKACLNCHAFAGGGDNYKRGDLEAAHAQANRSLDVHMASKANGGAGLECLDCHKAEAHRIAGRGSDLRELDSATKVACRNCHATSPHSDENVNRHLARVDCSVCHIPDFARVAATDMDRRWDLPGDLDVAKGLYEPHMEKAFNVVPEYRFFNGKSFFYQFGQPATAHPETGWVLMSGPDGSVQDPGSKIFAFKHHKAAQPVDPVSGRLLPLKIGIFFSTGNVDKAVAEGAAAVGWPYSGHTFADTERYMGIFHEVAPADRALTCDQCHGTNGRMDFAALGYSPKTTRNGKALCASCHEDESGEWKASEFFWKVHEKHVHDKRLDCSNCHSFQAAANQG